jgi:alpha-glucosidase (family GH31 glycosyl hydrolase)
MMLPAPFHLNTDPVADPGAVIILGNARFTLLTERLFRIEYSPSGQFEDHASQAFWFRRQPVPAFTLEQGPDWVEIDTQYLHLRCEATAGGFTPQNLSIEVKSTGVLWHYKDHWWSSGQLWGTARTLDDVNGHTRLETGPMSRAGWGVLDDSHSVVFTSDHWVEPRAQADNLDFYFFGYGHDYYVCLRDYIRVSGPIPLVPRYILGNWWSRYWAFTQSELTGLMQEFEQNRVPLSVCIIDMDWHLPGWTGYTWDRTLWPEPQKFFDWLHQKGLRTALNLHPSDGVGAHEEQYGAMAEEMDQDPSQGQAIRFDIADPRFAMAYFNILHHPYEKMGVDFWWMDWQQERVTNIPGLDPLWWLNHLHFLDLARDGQKRPFVFSRWGGLGNHRYPIGFSGDTEITWESLAFQPYFTATAANVGYTWWSHDIGGHMGGIENDELYTRWVQFGAFSPILRLHSTNNPYHDRRPWGRGPAANKAASFAMRLRHRLIPYIYSMAWETTSQTRPLITPMYYANPEDDAAYEAKNQYWFGSQLVAAPYIAPAEPEIGLARQRVWLPEGEWFNFLTGERVKGGDWRFFYGDLDDIPVFAKAGAIIPLAPETGWGGVEPPAALEIELFPGADNTFVLYEDDGDTTAYQAGHYALTCISQVWQQNQLTLRIDPVQGETRYVPAERQIKIHLHAVQSPQAVTLRVSGQERQVQMDYDTQKSLLSLDTGSITPIDSLELTLKANGTTLMTQADSRPAALRRLLRAMRVNTWLKNIIDKDIERLLAGEHSPQMFEGLSDAQIGALANLLQ